jgi:glucose-6-phosphate-specific signal transduction histidine kinase
LIDAGGRAIGDIIVLKDITRDESALHLMKDTGSIDAGRAGIGLIGMRERVAAVGGTIDIYSNTGRGTTIRVVLPVAYGEGRGLHENSDFRRP